MTDMGLEVLIGRRLKELRKIRGTTLDSLAQQTGFTKGYLSKIENAHKIPPIETLSRISAALNTEIAYFFQKDEPIDDDGDTVSIVRAQERRRVVRGGTSFGYDYESVAYKKIKKAMEPFVFTFPEDLDSDTHFSHEGEEMVFVLSGTVDFEVGGKSVLLSPGDCIYLDSSVEHRGRAVGGEAKALVVIYQPSGDAASEETSAP